jgi:hypothetical protein
MATQVNMKDNNYSSTNVKPLIHTIKEVQNAVNCPVCPMYPSNGPTDISAVTTQGLGTIAPMSWKGN